VQYTSYLEPLFLACRILSDCEKTDGAASSDAVLLLLDANEGGPLLLLPPLLLLYNGSVSKPLLLLSSVGVRASGSACTIVCIYTMAACVVH
jgi:hypothetical protein